MSESKTPRTDVEFNAIANKWPLSGNGDEWYNRCSETLNFARTLELELNEALASLPLVDDRVRNEAEKLLSQTLRHDDGNGASHGCVEVTGVKLRFELLIAQANQLRSQLTTAQQEKHQQQMQFLELYKLMPDIENKYVDRLYYHLANYLQRYHLQQQEIAELRKDKGRLDWLSDGGIICANVADRNFAYDANTGGYGQAETLRQAIDSAMKGTKE